MTDPFDLQRYLDAQAGMYDRAVADLRMGGNPTQWLWLVFPQMKDLGNSPLSLRFGIGSLSEAHAYATHPVLGVRLRECCRILVAIDAVDRNELFAEGDMLRLGSSMTLFIAATEDNEDFRAVLERYHRGELDSRTMEFVSRYP